LIYHILFNQSAEYQSAVTMAAMPENTELQCYLNLDPQKILEAIESKGFNCDGRIFALNSYENRVYQVGIEGADPVVAKFYRPGRWSDEQILEEHRFTGELSEHEIPVITPLVQENATLFSHDHFRFALYPRQGGRPPELDSPDHLSQLGRYIGRIHSVGQSGSFAYRPDISINEFADASRQYLLENDFIPLELKESYSTLCDDIIKRIQQCYERAGNISNIRLHGDCHVGNILWRDETPFILDFDDARTGPAIQDLWMFLSGDRPYMTSRLADLLEGYTEFCDFDARELHLLEALRSLRMMYFSSWIARRWEDPAFPLAFPYFNTQHYWQDQILSLREQAALMDEGPLEWVR
jgi:Ser/Thr protein kinase RdoA (MazF antagonist)